MFDTATIVEIPSWNASKLAQYAIATTILPAVSLIRSGEQETTFRLAYDIDDGALNVLPFRESTIIGRLPRLQIEGYSGGTRLVPDARKSPQNVRIDLTDDQIAQVLARWAERASCYDLAFVRVTYDSDGREHAKARSE